MNACIVLHNFVLQRGGYPDVDTISITGLADLTQEKTTRGGLTANNVRGVFAKYFVSDAGSVPWQMLKI